MSTATMYLTPREAAQVEQALDTRPMTVADWVIVDAAWDAAAPAKGAPAESFYDPITGENVTFDGDGVTVTDFLTGVTTITPFVPRHTIGQ